MTQSNLETEQNDLHALLGPSLNWHGNPTQRWTGGSKGLARHPMASIFGTHEETAYEALKWSIEQFGQQQPILLFDGKVLDGWHHYRACSELGLAPVIHELVSEGRVSPTSFSNIYLKPVR